MIGGILRLTNIAIQFAIANYPSPDTQPEKKATSLENMVPRSSINILHLPPSESENACHLNVLVSWYSTSKGRYRTILSPEGIRRRIYIGLGSRDLHLLKAKSV
ncbi:hypothetical protein TWF703_001603 [Orbilia oligospora]|uniref:Uncharacterized protein n=1 Tax=Orbilia oligospora TaxID=2813651 RepID=A0A7C8JP43_ORBOL|nr:hypothetical protein TWF703_001603 [Orbilia oligospora]